MGNGTPFDHEAFYATVEELSTKTESGLSATQQLFNEVFGSLALHSIDVLFGSMALGLAFQQQGETGWHLWLAMGASIIFGVATSGIQFRLWRIILRTKDWYRRLAMIIPGILVALLDTLNDGSLVEWFIGRYSPLTWPRKFENTNVMYWIIWGVVILVCGMNEPLVELFKFRKGEKATKKLNSQTGNSGQSIPSQRRPIPKTSQRQQPIPTYSAHRVEPTSQQTRNRGNRN